MHEADGTLLCSALVRHQSPLLEEYDRADEELDYSPSFSCYLPTRITGTTLFPLITPHGTQQNFTGATLRLWLKRRSPLQLSKSTQIQVQQGELSHIYSQLMLVPTNILSVQGEKSWNWIPQKSVRWEQVCWWGGRRRALARHQTLKSF